MKLYFWWHAVIYPRVFIKKKSEMAFNHQMNRNFKIVNYNHDDICSFNSWSHLWKLIPTVDSTHIWNSTLKWFFLYLLFSYYLLVLPPFGQNRPVLNSFTWHSISFGCCFFVIYECWNNRFKMNQLANLCLHSLGSSVLNCNIFLQTIKRCRTTRIRNFIAWNFQVIEDYFSCRFLFKMKSFSYLHHISL